MKKSVIGLVVLVVLMVAGSVLAQDYSGTFGLLDGNEVRAQKAKVPASGLYIGGTAVTATAAQLNAIGSKGTTGVTNVTAQTATVSATVTPQAGATVTATAVVTPQTFVPTYILADGTTNDVAIVTNATVAVTIANGAGLLTNVTATVAGVTTNVLNQR